MKCICEGFPDPMCVFYEEHGKEDAAFARSARESMIRWLRAENEASREMDAGQSLEIVDLKGMGGGLPSPTAASCPHLNPISSLCVECAI